MERAGGRPRVTILIRLVTESHWEDNSCVKTRWRERGGRAESGERAFQEEETANTKARRQDAVHCV